MPQSPEVEENVNVGSKEQSSSKDCPRRRPDLTSVVSEIMKMHAESGPTGPELERLIRGVIDEEVGLALANQLHAYDQKISIVRDSGNNVHLSESRNFQLQFSRKLSKPVLTGRKIRGEESSIIEVALVDQLTGRIVNSGPEAFAKVEIVVLQPDFDDYEAPDPRVEGFNSKIVRGRDGKGLLTGDIYLNLVNGIGFMHNVSFKHTKCWMPKSEFRLGARIVGPNKIRVREAKTEPLTIVDRRAKWNEKHYPPSLSDKVWRLRSIQRDGAFHKRLSEENINTVKDLLTLLNTNPQRLKDILGTGVHARMWEEMVDHAQKCLPGPSLYLYWSPRSQPKIGVVFNVVGQLMGLLAENQYVRAERLSVIQKDEALKLIISASQDGERVITFDDEASLSDSLCRLSIDCNPLNLPTKESSDSSTILESSRVGTYDNPQPGASSQNILPSVSSMSNVDSSRDVKHDHLQLVASSQDTSPLVCPGWNMNPNSIGTYDNPHLVASYPDNYPPACSTSSINSLDDFGLQGNDNICDTESMIQAFNEVEHLKFPDDHCSIEYQSSNIESQADALNNVTGIPLICNVDVTMNKVQRKYLSKSKKAQIRWRILSSVMKLVSMRKIQENMGSSSQDTTGIDYTHDWPLNFVNEVSNSLILDKNSGISNYFENEQLQVLESETDVYKQTTVNEILRDYSAAVTMNKAQRKYLPKRDKAQRKWRVLSSVIKLCSVGRNASRRTIIGDMPKSQGTSSQDILASISFAGATICLESDDSLDIGWLDGF